MRSFYRSRGSGKLPNNADVTFSLTRKNKDEIFCELYARETEEPTPFLFSLKEYANGGIGLETAARSETPPREEVDIVASVHTVLINKMKEPLNKTAIYEQIVKGEHIRGLSTTLFFNTVFPKLIQAGLIRECQSKTGHYEAMPSTSKLLEASRSS